MQALIQEKIAQNHLIFLPLPLLETDFDETSDELQAEIFAGGWDE